MLYVKFSAKEHRSKYELPTTSALKDLLSNNEDRDTHEIITKLSENVTAMDETGRMGLGHSKEEAPQIILGKSEGQVSGWKEQSLF